MPSDNQLRLGHPEYGRARKPKSDDRTNPIWDVLVELFGEPSPQQRRLFGRCAQYLREQEADPEEIRRRCMLIAELWGVRALSVPSLEKHWSRWDGLVGGLTPGVVERWQESKRFEEKRAAIRAEWGNE